MIITYSFLSQKVAENDHYIHSFLRFSTSFFLGGGSRTKTFWCGESNPGITFCRGKCAVNSMHNKILVSNPYFHDICKFAAFLFFKIHILAFGLVTENSYFQAFVLPWGVPFWKDWPSM